MQTAMVVLQELVALKDMKDALDRHPDKQMEQEYQRRKPLAWAAARKVACNVLDTAPAFIREVVHELRQPNGGLMGAQHERLAAMIEALAEEVARLVASINTPETVDFIRGVTLEATHQRERWGTDHDAGKTPPDWFWLLGYLAGKALTAQLAGDVDKARHHIITTAAACANWHLHTMGKTNMRPGIDTPKGE